MLDEEEEEDELLEGMTIPSFIRPSPINQPPMLFSSKYIFPSSPFLSLSLRRSIRLESSFDSSKANRTVRFDSLLQFNVDIAVEDLYSTGTTKRCQMEMKIEIVPRSTLGVWPVSKVNYALATKSFVSTVNGLGLEKKRSS